MENPDLESLLLERQRLLMPVVMKLHYLHSTKIYRRRNVHIVWRLSHCALLVLFSYLSTLLAPNPVFSSTTTNFWDTLYRRSSALQVYLPPTLFYLSFVPLIALLFVLLGNYLVRNHPDIVIASATTQTAYKLDRLIELFLEPYRNPSSSSPPPPFKTKTNNHNSKASILVEPAFDCLNPRLRRRIFIYKCINSLLSIYLSNSVNLFKFPQWHYNRQIAASLIKKSSSNTIVRKYIPVPNTDPLPTSTSPPHPVVLKPVDPDILAIIDPSTKKPSITAAKSLRHRAFVQIKAMNSKGLFGQLPKHAYIRPLRAEDLDQCLALETAGFPPEHRASKEKLAYRLRVCPELSSGIFVRQFDDSESYYNPTFSGLPTRALINLRVPSKEIALADEKCLKIEQTWKSESENLSGAAFTQAKEKYEKNLSEANRERLNAITRHGEQLEAEENASSAGEKAKPKQGTKLAASEDEAIAEDAKEIVDGEEGDLLTTIKNRENYQPVKSTQVKEVLIAYIMATKTADPTIDVPTMGIAKLDKYGRKDPSEPKQLGHTEDGAYIAIHSVVVSPDYQGTGIGTTLVADYVQRMETVKAGKALILLSEESHLSFYRRAGFSDDGVSDCAFGGTEWHNMTRSLAEEWGMYSNPFEQ